MRNHMASGWFYSPAQIKRYCASRISSLKPPETKLRNPYHIIRELNRQQWLFFSAGFFSWTWAGVDFFVVSLCVTEIAQAFQVNDSDVSWVSKEALCDKIKTKRKPENPHTFVFWQFSSLFSHFFRAIGDHGNADASPCGGVHLWSLRRPLWKEMADNRQPGSVRGSGVGWRVRY
ncbi:carboxylic acid transporter [Histoplasma capsulatum G186AR]|uniref:Carboxylic acid transporter n=1 Tax=Ajellomyces capsulatus TaxID=5037 RepID=A0A8H7Z5Z3_AJECA|nr:carboxylic acid transporter [Histoplasma capsulatum]QSS70180.1 carboxylic acid transporter [Histoplasma capsulatum G186AR]